MTRELLKQADEIIRLHRGSQIHGESLRGRIESGAHRFEFNKRSDEMAVLIKALADELRGKEGALKEVSKCGSYNASVAIAMHALKKGIFNDARNNTES